MKNSSQKENQYCLGQIKEIKHKIISRQIEQKQTRGDFGKIVFSSYLEENSERLFNSVGSRKFFTLEKKMIIFLSETKEHSNGKLIVLKELCESLEKTLKKEKKEEEDYTLLKEKKELNEGTSPENIFKSIVEFLNEKKMERGYFRDLYLKNLTMFIQNCFISKNSNDQQFANEALTFLFLNGFDERITEKEAAVIVSDLLDFFMDDCSSFDEAFFEKVLTILTEALSNKHVDYATLIAESSFKISAKRLFSNSETYSYWVKSMHQLLSLLYYHQQIVLLNKEYYKELFEKFSIFPITIVRAK